MDERIEIRPGTAITAFVDEYVKRISRVIDEQTLAKVEQQLADYGYVKVVRCRDCIYYTQDPDPIDPGWPMMCERTGDDMVEPYGFCWRGERKEVGDD